MLYQDDTSKKSGVWRYRTTVRLPSGETTRISGTAALKGKAAARDALDAHKRRLFTYGAPAARPASGGAPAARPAAVRVTFSAFAAEWLERYPASVGNRESSRAEKETHLRVRILPYFGTMALKDIGAREIAAFVAELETEPAPAAARDFGARRALAPKTIRNVVQNLRKVLTTAEEWGELDKCPAFPKLRRPPRPPIAFYTKDELVSLLITTGGTSGGGDSVRGGTGGREGKLARAALLVAAKCGLRAGELLGLTWEQVNFGDGSSGGTSGGTSWGASCGPAGGSGESPELRIDRQRHRGRPGPVKAGERSVPMPGSVAFALRELRNLEFPLATLQARGPVFLDDRFMPWTIATLRALLDRAAAAAGVRRLRWHDLRHTFASHLAQAGVPLIQIRDWLGHTSINMTMRYAHLAPRGNAHLVALLDNALDGASP